MSEQNSVYDGLKQWKSFVAIYKKKASKTPTFDFDTRCMGVYIKQWLDK